MMNDETAINEDKRSVQWPATERELDLMPESNARMTEMFVHAVQCVIVTG